MKKETPSPSTAYELLALLKSVLPKATDDPTEAVRIYTAVETELKSKERSKAFEKFCRRVELPDLETETIDNVTKQFNAAFGDGYVTIKPDDENQTLSVMVSLPDRTFSNTIKVHAIPIGDEEQEIKLKFIPFPVCMPGDKELVWLLAKRENMTSEESGIALTKIEDDFWASKTGQKLLRDRLEKSFPEFIARVPACALAEVGLKRHYKHAEAIKVLHTNP